jgi:tight adherence protein B
MRRVLLTLLFLAAAALGAAAAASAADISATPVSRLPFPERGYVVDLPRDVDLRSPRIEVTENGEPVRRLKVTPISATGVSAGVVLAIDASESMAGAPFAGALAAAREFIDRGPGQKVGLVAFDGKVTVLQEPTASQGALKAALASPPPLGYGTRIYDALDRSIALLARSNAATGSVVVLSDGADIGSRTRLDAVVDAAARNHIRVFTVGLRSHAFDGETLRTIAERTGGGYTEAATSRELASIYSALGDRFSREYLVEYRSRAAAESPVAVRIEIAGVGTTDADYVAPVPARVEPYHRSLLTRFVLSAGSIILLALLLALLVAWAAARTIRGSRSTVVERIGQFSREGAAQPRPAKNAAEVASRRRPRSAGGRLARLERDLEIARMETSARGVAGVTLAATLMVVVVLAAVWPIVAVLGLLTPLVTRAVIRRRLARVRGEFADQLPSNLQVLASALRAGHSFSGALGVVVENAHEPAKSELQRVLRDDQFGVPPEDAIRRVAERMQNRDLEQVALLAELQRTSGGNAAEVLDTVVTTIRERGELRRLVRTLTAQGRMARWILTALPIVLSLFLWLVHPDIIGVLFESSGGQIALVVAASMVIAGSALIQRIVDIEV